MAADGVHWEPLRLLQELAPHGWSPRNLCIWRDPHERRPPHVYKMRYHCGHYLADESTCLATSPNGFKWQPYNGGVPGRVSSNAKLRAHQIPASCGPGCVAAEDTLNCFDHSEADGNYFVFNHKKFGTEERWHKIRGVRLSINREFQSNFSSNFVEKRVWYFDRLGKEERFQRQIHSLRITSLRKEGIHLGILTVIEWPKIGSVSESQPLPPYEHDYMSVYLITSRDGQLFDLSSVYAYNPLIPRGVCTSAVRDHANWIDASVSGCEFDHGYVQPASGFVTDDKGNHHLYYEGRPVQHEDRWKVPATIAVASWKHHRIAALTRRPDTSAPCGEIVTRPFVLNGSDLLLNSDTSAEGSSLRVEVVSASSGLSLAKGSVSGNGETLEVRWKKWRLQSLNGRQVKLRIYLCGAAKVYAFTFGRGSTAKHTESTESRPLLSSEQMQSQATFSYSPHSGMSNQLIALMSAIRLAHATGLRFVLPPLLLGKTTGPLCGECGVHPHPGGPLEMQGKVAPISVILNVSALGDHLAPQSAREESTVRLCHIHRTNTLLTAKSEHCNASSIALLESRKTCRGPLVRIPMPCVGQIAHRAGVRTHIQLASLFHMDEAFDVEHPPLSFAAPTELSFNDQVLNWAREITRKAALLAPSKKLACAHLRSGSGNWDVVPSFFAARSTTVLRAFLGWLTYATRDHHVLVLADNTSMLRRDLGLQDCLVRKQCSLVDDTIRNLTPAFPMDSIPLVAAVSQQACSEADSLFLTRGSSFSVLIELLWNRRVKEVGRISQGQVHYA
ncbi:MAG: hypothetical protein SGPRY_010296 [Prymnesium sp.]